MRVLYILLRLLPIRISHTSVHCTLYTVQCTLYSVHCSVYVNIYIFLTCGGYNVCSCREKAPNEADDVQNKKINRRLPRIVEGE